MNCRSPVSVGPAITWPNGSTSRKDTLPSVLVVDRLSACPAVASNANRSVAAAGVRAAAAVTPGVRTVAADRSRRRKANVSDEDERDATVIVYVPDASSNSGLSPYESGL